jgi:hypothetical protein
MKQDLEQEINNDFKQDEEEQFDKDIQNIVLEANGTNNKNKKNNYNSSPDKALEEDSFENNDILFNNIEAYNKRDKKLDKKITQANRALIKDLGVKNLSFVGKAKSLVSYYFGGEDQYPKMNQILNIQINKLQKSQAGIDLLANKLENIGEDINTYYNKIIDEAQEYSKRKEIASKNGNNLQLKYNKIDNAIKDKNYASKNQFYILKRTHRDLAKRLVTENKTALLCGFNEKIRNDEFKTLDSYDNYININLAGHGIMKIYNERLNEHANYIGELTATLNEMGIKEISVENEQQKLSENIRIYQKNINQQQQYKFERLCNIIGVDKAKELIEMNHSSTLKSIGSYK